MKALAVMILGAGKGKRMKSNLAKVLHPIAGEAMLSYPIQLARSLQPERVVVVIGTQGDLVRERFQAPDLFFAEQKEQLGTGHAARIGSSRLKNFRGTVLILCGDVPLLTGETVRSLIRFHKKGKATLSVLTTRLPEARGYGRIIRGERGQLRAIVEDKDLKGGEKRIQEINTGIYCVESNFLFSSLASLRNRNVQKEYYLTDIVERAHALGQRALAYVTDDSSEVMGINNRLDLAQANQMMYLKISRRHMLRGVSLMAPQTIYIDGKVRIGRDTVIHPNCFLSGKTRLGESCVVGAGCRIVDSRVGSHVTIRAYSLVSESRIEDGVEVGPFAHLCGETLLKAGCKIGNFVEVKRSVVGKGTEANHLSFIGDTTLGEKVNVGAGTITCNFDGHKMHRTVIEDRVFIGSHTALVAPVKIGRNAVIGAGSTITQEVEKDTLAIARGKQVQFKKGRQRKES